MIKNINKFFQIIFLVIFLIVNFVVLFNHVKTNVSISFLFNNNILVLIGIFLLLIVFFLLKKIKGKFSDKWIVIILSIIMFAFEIFITVNALFRSGWDVSMIYDAAYSNIFDNYPKVSYTALKGYFERCQNNTFLLLYEMFFAFIVRSIGKGPKTLSLILVFCNCIIFTINGVMLYFCVKKITNNQKLSLLSWIIYFLLVGTSSWFLVPYSDSVGLLFPMLILFVYVYFNKNIYFKTFLIALISFVGYQVKPQVLIVFIAIVVFEFLRLFSKKITRNILIKYLRKLIIVCLTYCLVGLPIFYVRNDVMKLNPNKNLGLTHFLMMGLNTETNGVWNGGDVSFSASFQNPKVRRQQNLKMLKKRIKELTALELVKYERNKILINFDDGTFYFGGEGSFYILSYYDGIKLNKFVTSFAYSTGEYYIYISSIRQAIWLVVLILMLFSVWRKNNTVVNVVQLSLVGLFLFEMLFEARSRYLFIYVPYFIILAVIGVDKILSRFKINM